MTVTETTATPTDGLGVTGYWLACADGRVVRLGDAPDVGRAPALSAPVVGIAATSSSGCWLACADATVVALGGAPVITDVPEHDSPVVGIAAPSHPPGCWLACADGTVLAVGGAPPVGRVEVDAPVTGIAATPDGRGGWVVCDDGTVVPFLGAPQLGRAALPFPTVGIAAHPSREGCWSVGVDGSVGTSGDIPYLGASPTAGSGGPPAFVGVAAAPDGLGYLLVGASGRVVPRGLAAFHGPHHELPSDAHVVGIACPPARAVESDEIDLLGEELARHSQQEPASGELRAIASTLTFSPALAPELSIVIPVHGHCDLTVACLASIAAARTTASYEVIVVDDASPDDTGDVLAHTQGVRVVRHAVNTGFLDAANAGAAAANGEHIVFLNNDTEVHDDWLDELLGTVRSDPTIGAVGAMLIGPMGMIQEAGAIVWRDGSAHQFGHGRPTESRDCTFTRDVDYCSAACLLVRRDVFDQVGGFDRRYVPAYYEDVDLAFSIRQVGYRVVYQPRARCTHYEGSSHGTDESEGTKRYQAVNRAKFREKWALVLRDQPVRDLNNVRIASTRAARRAAFFDVHLPRFDRDAGSLRAREVVRVLKSLGFATTVIPEFPMDFDEYAAPLEEEGIEVVDPRGPLNVGAFLQELGPALDLVILSRPEVGARRAIEVRRAAPNAKLVFDTVDLASVRERRLNEVDPEQGNAGVAEITADLELALFRGSDASVTVTEVEAEYVRALAPDTPVFVWPTIHAVSDAVAPARGRHGLLFVGGFYHPPNTDGMEWFLRECLPLVRERGIDDTVYVVGENAPPWLHAAEAADVRIMGWVPDLEPLYAQARVLIAPLRFGAGIKGKVTDSLGHGLPVVTTPVGAEGIDTSSASGILVAEDAVSFADGVARLCNDDDLWSAMSRAGVATIEQSFSRGAVRRSIERGLVELGLLAPDIIAADER